MDAFHLRLALESSDVGAWQWDVATGHSRWDARCKRLFGLPPDASTINPLTLMHAIHAEDRDRTQAAIDHCLESGGDGLYDIEYRIIGYDGVVRWCHATGRTIFENGKPVRTVGTVQEITTRKQSETQRDAALAHLRAHVDNAPLGIIEWDRDFRVLSWSRGAEAIFGWSQEEVIGKHPYDWRFVHELDIPLVNTELTQILERPHGRYPRRSKLHNRNVAKNGSTIEAEWYNSAIYDEEGQVTSVLSMVSDITARVRAEADRELALARAEVERTRFQGLLLGAPAIVLFMRGPDHIIEFVNEAFVGVTPEANELLGRPHRDVAPKRVPPDFLARIDRVYSHGEPYVGKEVSISLPRGDEYEEHFFNFTFQPIRQSDGSIEGVACFSFDVTESVRARQALERVALREEAARKQAEDANRIKQEFLSTLSHELRTPLNAIIGWADILQTANLTDEEKRRALETIGRNARAQARLIDDLLDLSGIVHGKLIFSPDCVDLARIVETALDSVRLAVDAKGINVQLNLESHADVVGDTYRLQQIVCNLLSNAIKFTPKGGCVQVQVLRMPSCIRMSVTDNGQGINPAFLPYVFERFRQANSTISRQFGGLGLGLSIVRSLVELHGGTATAMSDGPGQGATFTIELPKAPLRTEADQLLPMSVSRPETRGTSLDLSSLKGLRVLVVDDELDAREMIAFLLRDREVSVTSVENAAEGFLALQRERFDVLLSDIGMPEEDGLSFLRRVRQLPAAMGGKIPALALTAYARSEDRTAVFNAGFSMHMSKPIEPTELLMTVAKLGGVLTS